MLSLTSSNQYYLYSSPTDMRGSFDSLCGIVRDKLGRSPTSGEVYIFLNRRRTQVKLLHWEHGGFVMYYKRLERGNFELPSQNNCHLTWTELVMMIEGISLKEVKMRQRYVLNKSA
jgi:transposase